MGPVCLLKFTGPSDQGHRSSVNVPLMRGQLLCGDTFAMVMGCPVIRGVPLKSHIYFETVVRLPDNVEVTTDEEDEDVGWARYESFAISKPIKQEYL